MFSGKYGGDRGLSPGCLVDERSRLLVLLLSCLVMHLMLEGLIAVLSHDVLEGIPDCKNTPKG
jgi:hypothetical protein